MATTARTLVSGAFQELGLVRPGETVEAEDAQFGLERMNDMLDAWRSSSLYDSAPYLLAFASLNESRDFPPAYVKAIRLSLAEDIAHTYNRDPARIERRASASRRAIERANAVVPELQIEAPLDRRIDDFLLDGRYS